MERGRIKEAREKERAKVNSLMKETKKLCLQLAGKGVNAFLWTLHNKIYFDDAVLYYLDIRVCYKEVSMPSSWMQDASEFENGNHLNNSLCAHTSKLSLLPTAECY